VSPASGNHAARSGPVAEQRNIGSRSGPYIVPGPASGEPAVSARAGGDAALRSCGAWFTRLFSIRKPEPQHPLVLELEDQGPRETEGPPAAEATHSTWWDDAAFARLSRDTPPDRFFTRFLENRGRYLLQSGNARMLDAGFETGAAGRAFLGRGGREVHAVDVDHRCLRFIQPEVEQGRISAQIGRIQNVSLPGDMDLVFAHYLLPFLGSDAEATLNRFFDATRPGGYLLGACFGAQHPWVLRSDDLQGYTRDTLGALIKDRTRYQLVQIWDPPPMNRLAVSGQVVTGWQELVFLVQRPEPPACLDLEIAS
jgi:SAM-dependent methyltransferase